MIFSLKAPVVMLHVGSLSTSVDFYQRALGFRMLSSLGNSADASPQGERVLLQAGDVTLMLAARTLSGTQNLLPDAFRHDAHADIVLCLVCMELEALCDHLRTIGIRQSRPTNPIEGMQQVFVQDPDGYRLCLQRPLTTT